jgi:hypothetical protein
MSDEDGSRFLIPPPPPGTPGPVAKEGSSAAADSPNFITLPSDVAESATHRVAGPRAVRMPAPTPAPGPVVFFPTARNQARWRISLPDREQLLPENGAALLGRNPGHLNGWTDAELIPIDDPAKSLSKTHALLEMSAGTLWIYDLNSTNGVWVTPPGGSAIEVQPGERVEVPAGSTLELGEFSSRITRN